MSCSDEEWAKLERDLRDNYTSMNWTPAKREGKSNRQLKREARQDAQRIADGVAKLNQLHGFGLV